MVTFQEPRAGDIMLPVEEAQQRVLDEVERLDVEIVPLAEALGRVLAEHAIAPRDIPSRDNSAMDGYAVRAADVERAASSPVFLKVIEDVPAGRLAQRSLGAGQAIRIMTGALLPDGADAVVPVELTDAGAETVSVLKPVVAGANVRRRGEDMKQGAVVLEAGARLHAAGIGVLASAQKPVVRVRRRPVVAILSTGDEIIDVDQPFEEGMVVNSNSWSLAALVREAGAIPKRLGIVPDRLDATRDAIREALAADFVLSTGGVSVGTHDFVKDALDELGAETKFWQVAMKPGKPLVLSRVGGKLYFGLPGNPVSCMVSFLLFVAPALRKAMGQTRNLFPPTVAVTLEGSLRSKGDRRHYLRVRIVVRDGGLVAIPMTAQGSGVSTSMVGANAFAILDQGVTEARDGERVPAVVFGRIDAE